MRHAEDGIYLMNKKLVGRLGGTGQADRRPPAGQTVSERTGPRRAASAAE